MTFDIIDFTKSLMFENKKSLYDSGAPWEPLLGIPPCATDAVERARSQLQGREYPREQLVEILNGYNQSLGNDDVALSQVEQLRQKDRFCIVTGQQVGLLGGPLYTILKAMSCLKLAREVGAVPIFWAATEDHDIDEVDRTVCLDERGNLRKLKVSLPRERFCVEDILLTPKVIAELDHHFKTLKIPENYQPNLIEGKPYGQAMVQMLVRLFAGTGLVFVEPYLLRPLASSFFQKEIVEAKAIQTVLKKTSMKLQKLGGKVVLDFKHGTNLFMKDDQKRRQRISVDGKQFIAGGQTFSCDDLLKIASQTPERFSANVVSRPVLQSSLVPVLSYIAGPGEIAYYHHLLDYHRYHNVPMPWIVPRLSATFIPERWQKVLKLLNLKFSDPIPVKWEQTLPEGVPSYALHYLRNLLYPYGKLQERVLNFWETCEIQ